MTSLRLLLGLPAMLWAMAAPAPKAVKWYFGAQIFNIVLTEIPYGHIGPEAYTLLYGIGLTAIMLATGDLVWNAVGSWKLIFFAVVLSSAIEWAGMRSITRWDTGALAGLVEGGLLFSSATALCFKVPFLRKELRPFAPAYAALLILWFLLGIFDFAYAKGLSLTGGMNLWIRSALTVGTFSYVACKLRGYEWVRP